jgi:hypothetical protein
MFSLIAGVSFLIFWPVVALLLLCGLGSISENFDCGDKPSWGWWCVWTLPALTLIYLKFHPDLKSLATGYFIYLVVGIIYSLWRWFRECVILRRNYDKVCSKVESWPSQIQVPNSSLLHGWTRGTDLNIASYSVGLKEITPDMSEHKGLISNWICFWAFLLLRDLTIDLITTIQNSLRGAYQGIANRQFKA